MKLSVIIVNYNVKYFLEQALHAVRKASKNMQVEVWVVDNNSVDGSCSMVREKFAEVHLIENKENVGFSRANNQAIQLSQGEYVLLLNPDTVVQEDTFDKTIQFMDTHPEAGGLGVKMIDGSGNYLPESKRGLPTPLTAFYKVFGLTSLFPRSRKFARYYMGHLPNNQTHEVEILAGAFMLLRRSTLDITGLLDETFFMYGEDIDLSYRITKAGYKNYYFPHSPIIHYKGESTKKGSLNYVMVFYNAMLIFARKHFAGNMARSYMLLINLAIYFRAALSVVKRVATNVFFPLLDATLIWLGYKLLVPWWENYKFPDGGSYMQFIWQFNIPSYMAIWLAAVWLTGGYKRPISLFKLFRGIAGGTLAILVLYALLPEDMRFSRVMILLGAAWTSLITLITRLVLAKTKFSIFRLSVSSRKRMVLVGNADETQRVQQLLQRTHIQPAWLAMVNNTSTTDNNDYFIGNVLQLREIVKIHRIDEIIFCAGSWSSADIIAQMLHLADMAVAFKIAPPESLSVIGSNSIHTEGELYTVNINAISTPSNRAAKRAFDVSWSVWLLLLLPLLLIFKTGRKNLLTNILAVLSNRCTWVGYSNQSEHDTLPTLKQGIYSPSLHSVNTPDEATRVNLTYARNYSVVHDLKICLQQLLKRE